MGAGRVQTYATAAPPDHREEVGALPRTPCTMRVELIGHFKPCMTEIYLHIVARMAD